MRHQWASVHELAQIGVLSGIPGETLGKLAGRMERRKLAAGEAIELVDPFAVVITGLVTVVQADRPARRLQPGDSIVEGPATLTALMPATVASCERSAYSELLNG